MSNFTLQPQVRNYRMSQKKGLRLSFCEVRSYAKSHIYANQNASLLSY